MKKKYDIKWFDFIPIIGIYTIGTRLSLVSIELLGDDEDEDT